MNHKFFDVGKDKQDRIINAALRVFALNGYRHASTDEIVRYASISKGLLFHYFESKLGLYSFLYDYSTRFMQLEFSRRIGEKDTEFFPLMEKMEEARMQVFRMYPYMRRFLDRAGQEDCPEAVDALGEARAAFGEKMENYYRQADYSVFVPEAACERVIKCMEYTLEGLTEEYSAKPGFDPEELETEIKKYLKMFETVFCAKQGWTPEKE